MAYTDYAPYVIFFHNQDEYNFAVASVGGTPATGGIFYGSPQAAAAAFSIPYPFPSGDMDNISKGVYYSPGYVPPVQLNPTAPPNVILTDGVASVVVPGTTGTNLSIGQSRTIKWAGSIVYMKGANPNDPLLPTAIPQRRFFGGFETQSLSEGFASTPSNVGCRDSSRTIDGLGGALRPGNNFAALGQLALLQAGYTSPKSWERFYFRIRRYPAANFMFWRCNSSVSPSAGMGLQLSPTGTLSSVTVSAINVVSTVSSSSTILSLNKWYKADVFLRFGLTDPFFLALINAVTFFNSAGADMTGTQNHSASTLGQAFASDTIVEMDFDDWVNSEWPLNVGVLSFDSLDYLMGSHIRRTWNISGTAANYTPVNNYATTNQSYSPDTEIGGTLVSTTASALLTAVTDIPALGVQDKFGELAVGPIGFIVGAKNVNSIGSDGQIGYTLAGGAAVLLGVNDLNSSAWSRGLYKPSGLIEPIEISPLGLRYVKAADGSTITVRAMSAVVEYIGIWGQEDVLDSTLFPTDLPRINWLHNCNYANTPYGMMGPSIDSMVYAVGGTYTGNGTFQEITLPSACHMLFIRGLSTGTNGIKFFGAGIGGGYGVTERVIPNAPLRMYYDATTGLFKFSVSGTGAEWNQNAASYQYIAFCDPGMRFCCAGAYNTPVAVTSRTNLLQNDGFLPEFAFVQHNVINSASNSLGLWARGPGNLANTGNPMDGTAPISNFGSFSLGAIVTGAGLHNAANVSQTNYLAFRSSEPGCGWVGAQCLSYTGNGAGSRVINLTPASGRFPLFALVIPTTGSNASYMRDPSHGGANSSRFDTVGSTSTTAITAGGLDTITVGITLNANGVVYNVFVIPGALASWANGTFWPANCDSVDPFYNPVLVPPTIAVMGQGGLVLGGGTTLTLLKNISGIYTLVPGKTNDTLYDRQTGQASVDVKIPNPSAKTGYVGG